MTESGFKKWVVALGAGCALLAVVIGAFSAHALKQLLDAYALGLVETGARYQMYHALGLVLVGCLVSASGFSQRWLRITVILFCIGIVLFCGSLYLLALSGVSAWGAVTPIGGAAFIFGWLTLILAALTE